MKKYSEPGPVKNGPAPQHWLCHVRNGKCIADPHHVNVHPEIPRPTELNPNFCKFLVFSQVTVTVPFCTSK